MDYTDEELEDLATMRALRQRLRACADARVAACLAMPHPTTWLEIYRQMRAIEATDRMLVRLYSPLSKRRSQRKTPTSPPHSPNGTSVPGKVSMKLKPIDDARSAKPADAASPALAATSVPKETMKAAASGHATATGQDDGVAELAAHSLPMNRRMRRRAEALSRRTQAGP